MFKNYKTVLNNLSLDLSHNNILKLDNVAMYDSLLAFKLTHNNLTVRCLNFYYFFFTFLKRGGYQNFKIEKKS